jgi:hypothetical protein
MKLLRLSFFGVMLLLQGCPVSPFSRTAEFRAQARVGQSLVRAIEAFRKDTGTYPATLAELTPKYLPKGTIKPEDYRHDWDYYTVTNAGTVSYGLSCFMGKGGVRYAAPNWISNEDGHEEVVSLNP